MATRRDRAEESRRRVEEVSRAIGREIREARLNAGISQAVAGKSVGMSHSQFGRIERADLTDVTVQQLGLACGAVGLKIVVRAYPDGEPVRDGAQLALLERLRRHVPETAGWRTEVPLALQGDLRAWDAVIRFSDGSVAVEAETRLRDLQALERRIALKQRDGTIERGDSSRQ